MGLGMPIPDLSNKPGPGRPGWGPIGSYDFQFRVEGQDAVVIKANAAAGGSFTVQWPNGNTQVLSGNNPSVTAPDATDGIVSINNENDADYCNEFAIVGGKGVVREVISWGKNPWSIVEEAFKDCVNLTDISTTSFIAGTANRSNQASGCIMGKMFLGCTSLLEVDIRTWDLSTNGASWRLGGPFANLANLQKLDATGLKIKFFDANNVSTSNFAGIGTNVADGCEFKMAGLDLSTSSTGYLDSLFSGTKFKGGSNLSNWKFPVNFSPGGWRGNNWFSSCILNDGILDISGWTTWPGLNVPGFYNFNSALTSQGTGRIDLSNLGLTNASDFSYMFYYCQIKEIIGLNTWGACAGNANMFRMFMGATLMRINPNDNFSDTFIASSSPTNLSNAFSNFGNGLLDSECGVAMNFNNIDFSNAPSFDSTWRSAKLLDAPNFSTATFDNNNTISFPTTFRSFNALNVDSSFVLNGGKVTSFANTFYAATINTININDGVDLSALTYVGAMFYYANVTTATLPSNADYSSLTGFSIWITAFNGFSVCQGDILMRRLKATNLNTNITAILPKITESPALVNSDRDVLENDRGWNITTPTPDATLPFAYASYAVDPTGITTISPTVTPPAGSVFTSTNSLNINSSTGVITIGSFRGGSTIRCTYPDGCYNEVTMLIQVPFVMRTTIPGLINGVNYLDMQINPQMSAGECFVDWGDSSSQILTGQTAHTYSAAGDYDIKIFDSPNGSKFENFTGNFYTPIPSGGSQGGTSYNIDVTQWGDIQWKNGSWFTAYMNKQMYIDVTAASNDYPDLSQVTSLSRMFSTTGNGGGFHRLSDPNGSFAGWDVSNITDMSYMFARNQSSSTPLNLANWDVSNVQDFSGMFKGAKYNALARFSTINMSNWKTSSATNMSLMFYNTSAGSISGIENFNTSLVTNLNGFARGPFKAQEANYKTKIVNAGTADEFIAWDVSNCVNFGSMFAGFGAGGGAGQLTDAGFPTNWKLSSDVNDNITFDSIFYYNGLSQITNADAFATKTISAANSPYGTQYTAWDVSRVSSFNGWNIGGTQRSQTGVNWNLSSWQVTSNTTTCANMFNGSSPLTNNIDQDLGHWDITGITASFGDWLESNVELSTSNYDSLLDNSDGWGSQAANVQSGIAVSFGTSKYSPGNQLAFNWGANNNPPGGQPSGQNIVYSTDLNLKTNTNVGDIVYWPGSGSNYADFAKITGYLPTSDFVAYVTPLTGTWPVGAAGTTRSYQVYDSDAAKGRFALLEAGWTITDGGVDLPFESAEIEIEIAPGQETFRLWNLGMNAKIDWGDGNGFIDDPNTGNPYNITYPDFTYPTVAAGTTDVYRIKVRETDSESFSGFRFGFGYQYGNTSGQRVRKIISWGSQIATSYAQAFQGADLNKAGFTNTLPVDSNGKVTKPLWIGSISNFNQTFKQANLPANADFSNWATGLSATNLSQMFNGNTNFIGNGLANWNLTNVIDMSYFVAGTAFNSSIAGWDLQSCTDAKYLFFNTPFNHPSISNLNLHNITNIASMFEGCTSFNQDVDTKVVGSGASAYLAWDTDPVTEMYGCFKGCNNFNYSIGKWNIGQLSQLYGLASFFAYVATNVNGGYTYDLLTKDVTVGAGTPVAKTYVAWDVGQVNAFGGSSQNFTTTLGMFYYSNFNGDISNWDMSGLGAQGGPVYQSPGQWGRVFQNNDAFNQDISTKTITNVSGKGTYTAWDMSNWTGGRYAFYQADAFNQNLGNWTLSTTDTSSGDMLGFFGYTTAMTTANYTDSFTGWANTAKTNNGFPKNKAFARQYNKTFDTTRTNGITAFTVNTAGRARSYLTLDVTVSGGASTVNGVYYYDYANSKWVKEADANATIEWNGEESSWELKFEGEIQHTGSGGSQAAGPESSTSWSGGISVADSSLGWSISDDTITN